jgi:glycosyltransferase involved in cell wall biosynthesis
LPNSLVSIIIPTFNAERYIETCLLSVQRQTYKDIETVVVDNLSKDNTVRMAQKYDCKIFSIQSTWSEALIYGIEHSDGKYYFVMESSLEIFPSFIAECVQRAEQDHSIVGLIGPEFSKGEGFWAECMNLERALNLEYEVVEAPRFIRRTAYNEVGGYDTTLEFGDDWDFFARLRKIGKVSRVKIGWIHHEGRPTPYGMMRKKYRYGRTARRYLKKYFATSDSSSSIFQFLPIRPNVLQRGPLLRRAGSKVVAGYLLLKTVEMLAVVAAMATSRIDEARGKEIRYGRAKKRLSSN